MNSEKNLITSCIRETSIEEIKTVWINANFKAHIACEPKYFKDKMKLLSTSVWLIFFNGNFTNIFHLQKFFGLVANFSLKLSMNTEFLKGIFLTSNLNEHGEHSKSHKFRKKNLITSCTKKSSINEVKIELIHFNSKDHIACQQNTLRLKLNYSSHLSNKYIFQLKFCRYFWLARIFWFSRKLFLKIVDEYRMINIMNYGNCSKDTK